MLVSNLEFQQIYLPAVIQLAASKKAEGIWQLVAKSFPGGSVSKESACNVGDLGSIPGLGRSSRVGNGNQLQYSRLATVGVSKSRTRLSDLAQHNRGPHGGKEKSQKPSRSGTSQGVQSIILLLREIIRDYVVNIMLIYFLKTLWSNNNTAGDHHQASSNIQQEDSLEIFLIPLKKKKKICKIEVHFVTKLKFGHFKESEIIYKTKEGIFLFPGVSVRVAWRKQRLWREWVFSSPLIGIEFGV